MLTRPDPIRLPQEEISEQLVQDAEGQLCDVKSQSLRWVACFVLEQLLWGISASIRLLPYIIVKHCLLLQV